MSPAQPRAHHHQAPIIWPHQWNTIHIISAIFVCCLSSHAPVWRWCGGCLAHYDHHIYFHNACDAENQRQHRTNAVFVLFSSFIRFFVVVSFFLQSHPPPHISRQRLCFFNVYFYFGGSFVVVLCGFCIGFMGFSLVKIRTSRTTLDVTYIWHKDFFL